MTEQQFDDITPLLNILSEFINSIETYKKKLEVVNTTKNNVLKNDKFCDLGLIISNFDFKKELFQYQIESKTKVFSIFINRLFLDFCFIQSQLLNVESILFDLHILTEKKLDKNLFKRKNIKIIEFKDILNDLINNYKIISDYLDKFNNKLNLITDIINSEIGRKKISNTMYFQYDKLVLEQNKIFNLINQTIKFYYDLALEYLDLNDETKYNIFYNKTMSNTDNFPLNTSSYNSITPIASEKKEKILNIDVFESKNETYCTNSNEEYSDILKYKNNHDIFIKKENITNKSFFDIKKDDKK